MRLYVIQGPGVKLYLVSQTIKGAKFSMDRNDAHVFKTREACQDIQAKYPDLDLQIE